MWRDEPGEKDAQAAQELATLRIEVTEELRFVRTAMAEEFNSLRSEILDLNIKLDRLLQRVGI
ncbi:MULTISPECIES: hypothetical protein [unclassified Nonomuraea]|uniref:hypothetical protein n=1 Tax=Nonomuraea sp. NPDC047529 TaxID=3155623 RepID=UPI00340F62FD